jgi:hypothetical protein
MARSRIALIVVSVVLIFQAASVAATPPPQIAPPGAAVPVCNGKYKGGLKPSPAELAEILKQHAAWLKNKFLYLYDPKLANDPRRANLCGAYLIGADLTGVHLDGADLTGADLDGANLLGATLKGADLNHADLKGAALDFADLDDAILKDAHLTGATLYYAALEGADLTRAHLSGADMSLANVADTDFDFDPDSPPKMVPGIYTARNLQLVKFNDQTAGLVKLRGAFKDLGLRTQESQLTYAIRRSEPNRKLYDGQYVHSWSERALNTVFFD